MVDSQPVRIDNILELTFLRQGNISRLVESPYSKLCIDIRDYANFRTCINEEVGYFIKDDEVWLDYDIVIADFCRGFDHVKNFLSFRDAKEVKGKKVNIIDSFLVLEKEIS